MVYPVRIFGDPVLREKAKPVATIDMQIKQLVQDMFETMYAMDGIGLAAPQIGVGLQILVIDLGQGDASKIAFINPNVYTEGELTGFTEGCLSVPGITGEVLRPEHAMISGTTLDGKTHELRAEGLLARAIQHEADHLNGIIFVDRFSAVRRALVKGKLRRLVQDFQTGKTRIDYSSEKENGLL
ncbi:MAG: peptide deformylase [Chlamydiota bacterium]|nr:peptide deformylase [Chlamydiota bacterium]